jgi:hypothetical protein
MTMKASAYDDMHVESVNAEHHFTHDASSASVNMNHAPMGETAAASLKKESTFSGADVTRMLIWTGNVRITVKHNNITRHWDNHNNIHNCTLAWDYILDRIHDIIVHHALSASAAADTHAYVESQQEQSYLSHVYPVCQTKSGRPVACHSHDEADARHLQPIPVTLRTRSMTWRVLSSAFSAVMDAVSNVPREVPPTFGATARLVDASASSHDVTEQYIDAKTREATLIMTRETLEKVLVQANSVHDVMTVMREVQSVTERMEQARQRLTYLQKGATLSTIYVRVNEELPDPPIVIMEENGGRHG